MLLGGAILPPAETLIVEGLLLLPPEEALPLLPDEDGPIASEEVPAFPLLLGAGPFGARTVNFGGSIFKLVGRPVIEMDLPNAKDPNLPGVARVRIALFKAVSLRVPDSELVEL